jgi:integrase
VPFVRSQLGLDDNAEANGRLQALFVISITLGLRPAELRKLTWDHVDLNRGAIHAWRSASKSGDTKPPKSKRSLELPKRAVIALTAHRARQAKERRSASEAWHGQIGLWIAHLAPEVVKHLPELCSLRVVHLGRGLACHQRLQGNAPRRDRPVG